jgi:hypothetical protein
LVSQLTAERFLFRRTCRLYIQKRKPLPPPLRPPIRRIWDGMLQKSASIFARYSVHHTRHQEICTKRKPLTHIAEYIIHSAHTVTNRALFNDDLCVSYRYFYAREPVCLQGNTAGRETGFEFSRLCYSLVITDSIQLIFSSKYTILVWLHISFGSASLVWFQLKCIVDLMKYTWCRGSEQLIFDIWLVSSLVEYSPLIAEPGRELSPS